LWPGIGEAVKRLSVAGLDGGEVLAMAGGELAYIMQPRERGREVRDTPCQKKEKEGPRDGSPRPEWQGDGAPAEFDEG
jgi:hypothetical protein